MHRVTQSAPVWIPQSRARSFERRIVTFPDAATHTILLCFRGDEAAPYIYHGGMQFLTAEAISQLERGSADLRHTHPPADSPER